MVFADAAAVHGEQSFQGAIFDVDGVLVDSPHFRAWRDALRELMTPDAAKAGRMAALGVARLGDTEALVNAGADLAVRSLDEMSRPALADSRLEGKTLERTVEA